jgi:hypothetical protein
MIEGMNKKTPYAYERKKLDNPEVIYCRGSDFCVASWIAQDLPCEELDWRILFMA